MKRKYVWPEGRDYLFVLQLAPCELLEPGMLFYFGNPQCAEPLRRVLEDQPVDQVDEFFRKTLFGCSELQLRLVLVHLAENLFPGFARIWALE